MAQALVNVASFFTWRRPSHILYNQCREDALTAVGGCSGYRLASSVVARQTLNANWASHGTILTSRVFIPEMWSRLYTIIDIRSPLTYIVSVRPKRFALRLANYSDV